MAKIIFNDVYKKFGNKSVLNGLSFTCENEVLFLAGKNGAGKTTLIRSALKLEKIDRGDISYISNSDNKTINTGAVFDTPCLYGQMTCEENINLFCTGFLKDKNHVKRILENLNIDRSLLKKLASKCSFGQQHRISVAIALIRKPTFLFLDEPTIGLDPISWKLVRESILRNKQEQNGCIIITGQDYFEMADFSEKLVILDEGVAKFSGKTQEFLKDFPYKVSLTIPSKLTEKVQFNVQQETKNNDGSYTYVFGNDVKTEDVVLLTNANNIPIISLSTIETNLKDAVYTVIGGGEQ
ncbi:MAG: ABC transporter ATP-binding protein [Clostridia bacterium]|nr:ABC transporter ATP-binding protein [Clostridia bacterium]